MILFLLGVFLSLSLVSMVLALPALPTEFYGNITTRGSPVPAGDVVTGSFTSGNVSVSCASFTVVNNGTFGLLTCPVRDPSAPEAPGIPLGSEVQFYLNGELAQFISGDNTTTNGSFKYVLLSYPPPACGDGYCDKYFETPLTCPLDCRGNQTANNTNQTGNQTGNSTGNGTGTGGGGGGGGGGGSVGGGASHGTTYSQPTQTGVGIVSALATVAGATAPFGCTEDWYCSDWTNCTIEGLQTRICVDHNNCGTSDNKPAEAQECEYQPTCHDGMQNGDETGVDCGGSLCSPCPGCFDGIQDGNETGVDCGGSCRPCDSCFDGVQDYGETGVDCGGPCPTCNEKKPALLEYPSLICEKSLDPLSNDARWFFLLVFLLASIRASLYARELRRIRRDQLLDDFKRAQAYYEERREMVLFILVTIAVCLLSYGYYYEFLLCNVGYQYLWLFLLVLILVPLLIYSALRALTYSDGRKLALLRERLKTHDEFLADLMTFENTQLVEVEKDIAQRIEAVATNLALIEEFNKLPDLKKVYEDIITLYYEYHKSKTPTGIEKDLCDRTYAIETDERFKEFAAKYPEIDVIYRRLALLYHHYEEKQKLYDELAKEREARAKKDAAGPSAPQEDVEEENDGTKTKEETAGGKK